jgi:predicted O-methyltransferase YrrM
MIVDFDKAAEYTRKLLKINNERILEIKEYGEQNKIPIITEEVLNFMIFTANMKKAADILEIGTAIGYSGLFLAEISEKNNGKFYTIEIDEERYSRAKENFEQFSFKNVNLILGDALEKISEIDEKFDFIFIDAAKGQYKKFFDLAYLKLAENGIVFIDNIMFKGLVAETEIPKRYKTIVRKLNEFINYLNENYNFVLLPFGDGVGLVTK